MRRLTGKRIGVQQEHPRDAEITALLDAARAAKDRDDGEETSRLINEAARLIELSRAELAAMTESAQARLARYLHEGPMPLEDGR